MDEEIAGKVWDLAFGLPVAPVILGIVTAIWSGLVRDVLAGRTTLLMRPELYALPVFMGCVAYGVVLEFLPAHRLAGSIVCILAKFAVGAAAIHWDLTMPGLASLSSRDESKWCKCRTIGVVTAGREPLREMMIGGSPIASGSRSGASCRLSGPARWPARRAWSHRGDLAIQPRLQQVRDLRDRFACPRFACRG